MCLVLFIGLDRDSPLVAPQDFTGIDGDDPSWYSKVVVFSVEMLSDTNEVVARLFTTKVVRYAGSFEGCGCGFNACHVNDWEEPPEPDARMLAGRESRRLLLEYVEKHGVREIYACWSGDEALHPVAHMDMEPSGIMDWTFQFGERTMLRIVQRVIG